MRMIIFFAVVFAAVGFIVYQLSQFFLTISNPRSRYKGDRKFAKIELDALSQHIVPFDEEELKILSYKISETNKKRAFHVESFGYIETIYSEQLIAFYLFEYNDGRNLLLAKQSDNEIVFYNDNSRIEILIDNKKRYILSTLGVLTDGKSGAEIARLDFNSNLNQKQIVKNNEIIASFNLVEQSEGDNVRVFSTFNAKTEEEIIINCCYSIVNVLNII